jgi:hypothetical protein
MYEIGTVKLTWINPKDYTLLESKMYKKEDLQKALSDAKTKPDFMLFTLLNTKGDEYQWKLMPYGKANKFVQSMQLSKSTIVPYVAMGILGFAMYGIYKIFSK